MNNFEKIKQMEINELAHFIRTNKKINFNSGFVNICKHDKALKIQG